MHRLLRWKLVVVLVTIIGTSAFAWLPPLASVAGLRVPRALAETGLRLGLDLQGAVRAAG
jgi:preprotein translocase subunit SecD